MMNSPETPWLGYTIAGGVIVMVVVEFLTPLTVLPRGPEIEFWVSGLVAGFWWGLGMLGGYLVYRVTRRGS